MGSKRNDPEWYSPAACGGQHQLQLYNSLTRKKEVFIPKAETVSWYSCGPTVYDDSHMGHARSYISFDILRRVLQDYFGYKIFYVMNITDIDDKIIKRARTKHLVQQYKKSSPDQLKLLSDLTYAMQLHEKRMSETTDPDKLKMLLEDINKVKVATGRMIKSNGLDNSNLMDELMFSSESVLGEWLDKNEGHKVTDNSIFSQLPRHYEEAFNEDMEALNVLPADVVTRVSEYVPQIIQYVEKIISNGFAYESKGSIYFDVAKFDAQPDHYYAKLVPEAYGDHAALEDGEGALSTNQDKRSPNDFALWKASKPGEPSWSSPWGDGRPGWHIECSAMAGGVLGGSMDLHTGGVDLKFPHHDNELAQSEAHFNCKQWVNYFLHTGHLHIDGCKMSKSLKNFITIKQALENYTAAQLRVAFLLHSWKDTLDYSSNTMEGARQYLKMVTEFGLNVEDTIRRGGQTTSLWTSSEITLNDSFQSARHKVHEALCDNIDTRTVLDTTRDLLTESNKYMNNNATVNSQLLTNISSFVVKLLNTFGVEFGESKENNQDSKKVIELAEVVGNIREQLREMSRRPEVDVKSLQSLQLQLCDDIRDLMLPPLGVRLEDREQGAPSIKLVNSEELMKEIELKKQQDEAKNLEKEKKKTESAAKAAAKASVAVTDPNEMFKTGEYTAWDANGMPTMDKEGKEITKSQIKKLTKSYEAQKKKFEKWKASQ